MKKINLRDYYPYYSQDMICLLYTSPFSQELMEELQQIPEVKEIYAT